MMAEWAAILAAVGKALAPRIPGQVEPSKAPFDRAMRLVRHIDKIAERLSAAEKPGRVDLVRIAALYACVPVGKGKREEAADDAAELATDQLKNLATDEELELILQILREHRHRNAKLPEAKLLSDVVALEDVGLVGIWNAAGRYQALGRSLEQFVRLWRTQEIAPPVSADPAANWVIVPSAHPHRTAMLFVASSW